MREAPACIVRRSAKQRLHRTNSAMSQTLLLDLPDLAAIEDAAARIAPHAQKTPVRKSRSIDALAGAEIVFKCENLQRVGAFKFRGASNAVWSLPDDVARRGVVDAFVRQSRRRARARGAHARDSGARRRAARRGAYQGRRDRSLRRDIAPLRTDAGRARSRGRARARRDRRDARASVHDTRGHRRRRAPRRSN